MTELARTPPVLRRLFQTVDLAPLPQDDVIAEGVTIWKRCRAGRIYPELTRTMEQQTERVLQHGFIALPDGHGEDYRITSAGSHASAALGLSTAELALSKVPARRLAARLRRLFQLILTIRESVDVRFVEGGRSFEVFVAPVSSESEKLALFCIITSHSLFPGISMKRNGSKTQPAPGGDAIQVGGLHANAKASGPGTSPDPDVLAFLSDPVSYPGQAASVDMIETHMSLIFLVGDRVYKMKKPVRLGPVDFTALDARRRNCEREIAINQQLAPGVYLELLAVVRQPGGHLCLGGAGDPIEWLIVMKRLDQSQLLNHVISRGEAAPADIDRLAGTLAKFYAVTPVIPVQAPDLMQWWHEMVGRVVRSLVDPLFALPPGKVARVIEGLTGFLKRESAVIAARADEGRIIDGHGDLRPEHVYLGSSILLIDRLEFDPRLRWVDPFDEVAFLGMECERLGAGWIGPRLILAMENRLCDHPPPALLSFYRCYRAALRAALSIEHLRDPKPRTPERWPRQARDYLDLALASVPGPD